MKGFLNRFTIAKGSLPDFLVVGAQKSGTTYLYQTLIQQHPGVRGSIKNEVNFFSSPEVRGGTRAYQQHFPSFVKRERRMVLVGEKSPNYLFHPLAAKRAAEIVPDAKIVVLLRNPVDRAYSHYHHSAVKLGREPLSFEEALEAEPERIEGERERLIRDDGYQPFRYTSFSYLARGIYVDQLPQWHEHFGWERVFVVKSEELYEAPRGVFERLSSFLGLPAHDFVLRSEGRGIGLNKSRYVEPMQPETRERLCKYFEPHNQRLYEYLGVDFGW